MSRYVVAAALCINFGCASLIRSPTAETSDEMPAKVIDAHVHARFSGKETPYGPADTLDEWKYQMREAKIVGAISHVSAEADPQDLPAELGIIQCAGVGKTPNLKKLEAGLKTKKFSCIKVYLGYEYQWANHPNYLAVYKIAQKYDVPVVFHTGDTYTHTGKIKYADPITIDEIAVDFPKVNFVIAHCGNPWFDSAAEVAYKNPNVYIECSAMLIGDLTKADPEDIERFIVQPTKWIFQYVANPTKMMFGTDWPLVSAKEYLKAYKRAIPRKHWDAVFHDNAVRVFKINTRRAF